SIRDLLLPRPVYEIVLGARTELLSERSWEVEASDPNAISACVAHVADLDSVYFFGGWYSENRVPDSKAAFDEVQEQSVKALFRLVRTLHALQTDSRSPRLTVISNRLCAVDPGERIQPYSACVPGFTRAVMREYPKLGTQLIDVDVSTESNAVEIKSASGW